MTLMTSTASTASTTSINSRSQSQFSPQVTTLSNDIVTLQPLTQQHLSAFYNAGAFAEIWQWSLPNKCTSLASTKDWLIYSEEMTAQGLHVPFAIIDNASGNLVGSTRFCSINAADKNVEIGFTFITPAFQQTAINSNAKLLLLTYAFETLGAIRVEFKVHEKNKKSRKAVARLGASFEGILRNHRILSDGSYRNTVIFSIIGSEWPKVKTALINKMADYYV